MGVNEFFDFNKKERIGLMILLALMVAIIVAYFYLPRFLPPMQGLNDAEVKEQVEMFIQSHKEKQYEEARKLAALKEKQQHIKESTTLKPFNFNPNTLSKAQWIKMGFSEKQANIILNYIAKGGKFYKKGDMRRIYGIDENEYQQLEPYIIIPETKQIAEKIPAKENTPEDPVADKPLIIELNKADSTELILIRGIGPVFSSRIIKFRNYLGGFYSMSQLMEVYGIDSTVYSTISQNLTIDTTCIIKININTATFKELVAHPYLDYYLVKEIANYRQENGPYNDLAELKHIPLVYDDLYQKITPYLTIK